MAYLINRYNGTELVVLQDGTVDTTTSLNLVGRNYTGYGEFQNENFLFLLENFANDAPPPRPISGQTWFNTADGNINLYDGTNWNVLGSATVSDTAPDTPSNGMFWLKTPTNLLHVWTGSEWFQVGEAAEGFGATKAFSTTILSSTGTRFPVVELIVDDVVMAIISRSPFEIDQREAVSGFDSIAQGITMSSRASTVSIKGNLDGVAERARVLENIRTINGVGFDGSKNITITSGTTGKLISGNNIIGTDFDGSKDVTWSIEASSSNSIGKIVVRDTAGNFSAGTITANLVGNVIGNVSSNTGISDFDIIRANQIIGPTLSGNAFSATKLQTSRKINGVDFDGTKDITVPVAGTNIAGNTLAQNIRFSSLESLGTLQNLKVGNSGIKVGSSEQLQLIIDNSIPYISNTTEAALEIGVKDTARGFANDQAKLRLIPTSINHAETGVSYPTLAPYEDSAFDLGQDTVRFRKIYSDIFDGVATAAQYADLAEYYTSDKEYEAGTVLIFGGSAEVTTTNHKGDSRLAGVVSSDPAYVMNSNLEGTRACVALQGRVPCKIIGKIKRGEMLTTSSLSGYATRAENPAIGTVIGKSLEDKDSEAPGMIEIAVGRV